MAFHRAAWRCACDEKNGDRIQAFADVGAKLAALVFSGAHMVAL
jgi:hypothetical protein